MTRIDREFGTYEQAEAALDMIEALYAEATDSVPDSFGVAV